MRKLFVIRTATAVAISATMFWTEAIVDATAANGKAEMSNPQEQFLSAYDAQRDRPIVGRWRANLFSAFAVGKRSTAPGGAYADTTGGTDTLASIFGQHNQVSVFPMYYKLQNGEYQVQMARARGSGNNTHTPPDVKNVGFSKNHQTGDIQCKVDNFSLVPDSHQYPRDKTFSRNCLLKLYGPYDEHIIGDFKLDDVSMSVRAVDNVSGFKALVMTFPFNPSLNYAGNFIIFWNDTKHLYEVHGRSWSYYLYSDDIQTIRMGTNVNPMDPIKANKLGWIWRNMTNPFQPGHWYRANELAFPTGSLVTTKAPENMNMTGTVVGFDTHSKLWLIQPLGNNNVPPSWFRFDQLSSYVGSSSARYQVDMLRAEFENNLKDVQLQKDQVEQQYLQEKLQAQAELKNLNDTLHTQKQRTLLEKLKKGEFEKKVDDFEKKLNAAKLAKGEFEAKFEKSEEANKQLKEDVAKLQEQLDKLQEQLNSSTSTSSSSNKRKTASDVSDSSDVSSSSCSSSSALTTPSENAKTAISTTSDFKKARRTSPRGVAKK